MISSFPSCCNPVQPYRVMAQCTFVSNTPSYTDHDDNCSMPFRTVTCSFLALLFSVLHHQSGALSFHGIFNFLTVIEYKGGGNFASESFACFFTDTKSPLKVAHYFFYIWKGIFEVLFVMNRSIL